MTSVDLPLQTTANENTSVEVEESNKFLENIFEKIRFVGQVKWFNTKSGYGFITVCGNNFSQNLLLHNLSSADLMRNSSERSVEETLLAVDCEDKIIFGSGDASTKNVDSVFCGEKCILEEKDKNLKNSIENVLNTLKGKDIFVHYSSINAVNSQYKFLLQGEYVEFNILMATEGKYEYHSANVSGINGGTIMCETRNSSLPIQQKYPGKNLTYVDKSGVRHYSKFKSPRTNNLPSRSTANGYSSTFPSQSTEIGISSTSRLEESLKNENQKSNNFPSKPMLVRNKNNFSKFNSEKNKLHSTSASQNSFSPTLRSEEKVNNNMNDIVFSKENNYCTPPVNILVDIRDDNKGEYKTVTRGRNKQKNV